MVMDKEPSVQHPKILVFSTEKISDPAIDLAGLLKMYYYPKIYTLNVPCSSAIKPQWIMYAFNNGFDGVFIAADGTDCPYDETCTINTANIVNSTQQLMKKNNIDPACLRMAAVCSVCAESFVKHMKSFTEYLSKVEV